MTEKNGPVSAGEVASVWHRGATWICANLKMFRPTDISDPDQLKAIVELALFYSTIVSWQRNGWHIDRHGRDEHEIRLIEAFLVEFMSDPAVAEWARKAPALFNPYFVGYLAMRSVGYQTPMWEDALSRVIDAGFPESLEVTPYRRLELRYVARKARVGGETLLGDNVYAETALARCTNPVYLNRAEAYSITHTLFYLTDFGKKNVDMDPRQRERILAIVRMLLIHYRRKVDWDLVGELLINLAGLKNTNSAIFHSATRQLFAAQQPNGSIPGPNFKPSGDPTLAYVFKHCYHTTLVVLWLCASHRWWTAAKVPSKIQRQDA